MKIRVKVYNNIISFQDMFCCTTIEEFNKVVDYLSNTVYSHSHTINDNEFDILYKDKNKDDWYTKGNSIINFTDDEIEIWDGIFLKTDLFEILNFKNKMVNLMKNIPGVKDYMKPTQQFHYPNIKETRILIWFKLNYLK